MKIPGSKLGRTCCVQKLFLAFRTISVHNMFSPFSPKRRASDRDLPVRNFVGIHQLLQSKFCQKSRGLEELCIVLDEDVVKVEPTLIDTI